ncbi:unnamed protein product [Urochloa decumbens]|uniref:BTB domain-containing protein n=1 Tax=Urochloa decumbens TaxID=240449 RepID=A0ABC8WAM8_9POAL
MREYTKRPNANDEHLSLYLELHRPSSLIKEASNVKFKFSLLDQSGNPVPQFSRAKEACNFYALDTYHGFSDFIKWEDLEKSGCFKDDTFTVQCDLTFTTDLGSATAAANDAAAAPATSAAVPAPASSKLHEHLTDFLWKDKRWVDVTVDVGGEATFDAHAWLLSMRSPVLAELLASKEKKSAAGCANRRIEVKDVEPKVFEAALHYMYTNALPAEKAEEDDDPMAMAPGLLAAADRFKIDGLRLLCEETLSKRINVGTAAGILAVAEQHGCRALKAACLEFMSRAENLKAVMETEGYEKARAIVQPLVMEIGMKQWLAATNKVH